MAAITSEYADTAFCSLLAERLMRADACITRRELVEIGQIPRHCWFRAPRHYSASLCSDAAINHLSSLEPSIKPSARKALSLIRYPVQRSKGTEIQYDIAVTAQRPGVTDCLQAHLGGSGLLQ